MKKTFFSLLTLFALVAVSLFGSLTGISPAKAVDPSTKVINVQGYVRNSSAAAISGATVKVSSMNGSAVTGGSGSTDATGYFRFAVTIPYRMVAAGSPCSGTVSASGYQTLTFSNRILSPQPVSINGNAPAYGLGAFTLTAVATTTTGSLEGYVTNQTATAISGATVNLTDINKTATTNSVGYYKIDNIAAGNHPAAYAASGYTGQTVTVTITANVIARKDITLVSVTPPSTTSTVKGKITDATSSSALNGVQVCAFQDAAATQSIGCAFSDTTGSYTISYNAPSGLTNVTIVVLTTGYESQVKTVAYAQNLIADFTLASQASLYGNVTGTVTDKTTGAKISGANVQIGTSTATDANGVYTIFKVAKGSQNAIISATGYQTLTTTVNVAAGTTTTADFALTSNTTTTINKPVVTLTASPTSVTSGGQAKLTWTATNNPTTCAATGGWTGAKTPTTGGSEDVLNVTANTTYTLTCTNSAGSGSATATVQVTSTGSTSTAELTANGLTSTSIYPGSEVLLQWTTSSDVTSCDSLSWNPGVTIMGADLNSSFDIPSLAATTTYSMICHSPSRASFGASATVTVETGQTCPLE